MQMMDRRKFKRRKPVDGEARNRILDDIEPGVTAPLADRGSRVFARAKSDPAGRSDLSQNEILARTREVMQPGPADVAPINTRPVSPAEDAAVKRERIAELRREKARLQAERATREERSRAKTAALQAAEARRAAIKAAAAEQKAQSSAALRALKSQAQQAAVAKAEAEELEAENARLRAEASEAEAEAEALEAQEQPVDPPVAPKKPAAAPLVLGPDLSPPAARAPEPDPLPEPETKAVARKPVLQEAPLKPVAPAPRRALQADEAQDDAADVSALWDSLDTFAVDAKLFERNRIITAARNDLAHTAFDVLRTRLLQGLRRKGWKRVAITSPSKDCGKTFSAANLAISLSRQDDCRTILLDFDMRRPSLAKVFGAGNTGNLGDMLRGKVAPEDHLRCVGDNPFDIGRNLAIGFNDKVEPYASELLGDKLTAEVLDEMEADFDADVILFDMPPALYHDDVIAARSLFDGVLLVVGGGITKPNEVKDVERRLGADTPLLGSLLNFSEGPGITKYSY